MMVDPLLRIEALRKSFGRLIVTDDVTLEVLPGELHAIIGPNGAGKTTLINQICGLVASDQGRVVFAGEDVTALPPEQRAALAKLIAASSVPAQPASLDDRLPWESEQGEGAAGATS